MFLNLGVTSIATTSVNLLFVKLGGTSNFLMKDFCIFLMRASTINLMLVFVVFLIGGLVNRTHADLYVLLIGVMTNGTAPVSLLVLAGAQLSFQGSGSSTIS